MVDYFDREVQVGDIVLVACSSLVQPQVVISIPSPNTVVVSTCRKRLNPRWSKNRPTWYNCRRRPISEHNSKINIWVHKERIIKVGTYNGDMTKFKTVKKLENEWQLENPQS